MHMGTKTRIVAASPLVSGYFSLSPEVLIGVDNENGPQGINRPNFDYHIFGFADPHIPRNCNVSYSISGSILISRPIYPAIHQEQTGETDNSQSHVPAQGEI